MASKIKLSIVILNYNTKELVLKCLQSLEKVKKEVNFEVIVVDNASEDGSQAVLRKCQDSAKAKTAEIVKFQLIENPKNLGFAAGNNVAQKYCQGKCVLFLNSDTEMQGKTLEKCVQYLEKNQDVGAMTCKIVLPNGQLDRDARRSFPTPWVTLTHFSGLDRIFPHSKIFAQYWYGYLDQDTEHEVDALQGAFFLVRKKILDQLGWFDEDYFLDGEDIDLSWRIKQQGYKIMYYPQVSILHIKKAAKGRSKRTIKTITSGVNSMELFYNKHLRKQYPFFVNWLVFLGIKFLKIIRVIRFSLLAVGQ